MAYRIDARDLDDATFRFFAATCAAAARQAPAPPLPRGVAPAALLPLAIRHRIAAPVLERLAQATRPVDPDVGATLTARARGHRFAAIRRAQHLVDLSRALADEGIRHLVVKGTVLAEQLYGDIAARDSKDIDLLIDPHQFDAAASILRRLSGDEGLTTPTPIRDGDPKHHSFLIAGIEVEAHTRLLDTDDLVFLPFDQVWARRVAVPIGPAAMQALSPVDTLLYLCAHGTEHCWFRLKWLQDIARIAVVDDDALSDAMTCARAAGCDRIVSAALLLVDELFGIAAAIDPATDGVTAQLVALSKDALAAPAELASDPTLGWLVRRSGVQIGLRHGWRARLGFLRHLFTSARSFDAGETPVGADWRSYLSRSVRLLRHHARRQRRA